MMRRSSLSIAALFFFVAAASAMLFAKPAFDRLFSDSTLIATVRVESSWQTKINAMPLSRVTVTRRWKGSSDTTFVVSGRIPVFFGGVVLSEKDTYVLFLRPPRFPENSGSDSVDFEFTYPYPVFQGDFADTAALKRAYDEGNGQVKRCE